jgi:hypothetical protein
MRQRNYLKMVRMLAVHEKKGEVPEGKTADRFADARPLHDFTDGRVSGN